MGNFGTFFNLLRKKTFLNVGWLWNPQLVRLVNPLFVVE